MGFASRLTLVLVAGLLGCGGSAEEATRGEEAVRPGAGGKADSPADDLAAARAFWEEVAPLCEGHPSKGDCDDGDTTLFNGLLCAAGDQRGCAAVRASQSADGRWWRSPRRAGGNLGEGNSFSRDMSLGVMRYLVAARDGAAANRWLDWIGRNRPCVTEKPWPLSGCLVRGPHRMCRDDSDGRCTMTPATWALLHRVWTHLGLSPSGDMRDWEGWDGDFTAIEARANEPGYELHLKAVTVLLKQLMDVSRVPREELAAILFDKQPDNPFFRWLVEGPSPRVRARVLEVCPRREGGNAFRKHQWAWERDTASEAWRESMGWDCLFMAHLLD
jgi:hypothetical protein